MRALLPLLLLLVGCASSGTLALPADPPVDPAALPAADPWDCGFERGDLTGFGHPGEVHVTTAEGGQVVVVEEGTDLSALRGDERIDLPGDFALLLRPDAAARSDAVAHVTTAPFVPRSPWFAVDQLSEADGVVLTVRVLDEAGEQLDAWPLPVETGGHRPGLLEDQEPIPGFPDIDQGPSTPGVFVRQWLDLEPWRGGDPIAVRVEHRTAVEGVGFFTLLDNLCDGAPTGG